jgi:hypothetical protein
MIQYRTLEDIQREYERRIAQVREKFREDLRSYLSRLVDTAIDLMHEVDEVPSDELAPIIYSVLCQFEKDFLRVWDLYGFYLLEGQKEEAR